VSECGRTATLFESVNQLGLALPMMVRFILTVPPALFGLSSVDLCLFEGQYTYWILSGVNSIVPF
jgi:hypothetical protein